MPLRQRRRKTRLRWPPRAAMHETIMRRAPRMTALWEELEEIEREEDERTLSPRGKRAGFGIWARHPPPSTRPALTRARAARGRGHTPQGAGPQRSRG